MNIYYIGPEPNCPSVGNVEATDDLPLGKSFDVALFPALLTDQCFVSEEEAQSDADCEEPSALSVLGYVFVVICVVEAVAVAILTKQFLSLRKKS